MTVAVSTAGRKDQGPKWTCQACMHAHKALRATLENPSVTSASLNLPARCAGPHVSQPEGLESLMDMSNACRDKQSIVNDSQRPTNKMEHTRTPQIGTSNSGVLDTVVYAGGVNGLVGVSGCDG